MFAFSPEVARLRKKTRVIVIELPPEDLEVESEESQVKDLAFPRLNDHVVGGDEALRPWPEPTGGRLFLPLGGTVEDVLELREVLETPPETAFRIRITRERAISASVIAHLVIVLLLVITPDYRPKVPEELNDANDPLGIMRLWKPDPTPPPIPLQFFPAPGPKAATPGKNPLLSDKDRQAHGGDPKLPPLSQPKAVAKAGIRDLDAGKGASGGAVPTPPPARAAETGDLSKAEREQSLMALRQDRSLDSGLKRGARIPPPPLASVRPEDYAGSRSGTGGAGDDAGDGGAGYDREGGFTDSGALSFDTQGYDWGAYAAEMLRKIKRNWDVPLLAHSGMKGRLVIRFFILKDGTVDAERIVLSSQKPPYDNAAFQAIARSSRFRPLPDDLGKEREGVTITFFYNIRPDEERHDSGAR
jgi:TonB family protein